MRDLDLLVVGDLNADLILVGEDPVPAFGQAEKLLDSGTLTIGGSSAITACGAARLGLRTAFVGVVGDDPLGRYLLGALAERGVDVSACVVDPSLATGVSVILARPGAGGDRAILTAPGTLGAVSPAHVPADLLGRARHLHGGAYFLQGEALRAGLPRLLGRARAAGLTCSLDPNWDPSGRWDGGLREALASCDLFFPNREEALRVSGFHDLDAALVALAHQGPTVAAKLGAHGALVQSRDGAARWARAPAFEAVDATGAGDTFNAGYLYGTLAGWDRATCLALAVACGTLSTRAIGGTAGQPTLVEARTLAAQVHVTSAEAVAP